MTNFAPKQYFDLQGWQHAGLFASVSNVWEVLGEHLKSFLDEWNDWSIDSELSGGVHLLGDRIHIARGCRIEPGAVIVGPAILGENVTVRTGAYVRENIIVGAGCMVGAHSELKGAILLPGAKAPHQNYVGDTILGRDVNLGAGTICSNVKNIGREVTFRAGGELIHTGLRKLGAILGDGCKTGCNTVLNPGVLMGPESVTYPNATLRSGAYPAQTLVKIRQQQQIIELARIRRTTGSE
jgi:NDP-sugar pyrophosphorylase family protein